jgi:hypothetical protein
VPHRPVGRFLNTLCSVVVPDPDLGRMHEKVPKMKNMF